MRALELAKVENRQDAQNRPLLIVADAERPHPVRNKDVVEPDDGVAAIGSGGTYPTAAKALIRHTDLSPTDIVKNRA